MPCVSRDATTPPEPAAEQDLLGEDRGVDAVAAAAADRLVEREPEQAGVGEGAVQRARQLAVGLPLSRRAGRPPWRRRRGTARAARAAPASPRELEVRAWSRGRPQRRAAGAGQAGEALRDLEPGCAGRPGRRPARGRPVAALRDQQAEVERRPGDGVARRSPTPRATRPARSGSPARRRPAAARRARRRRSRGCARRGGRRACSRAVGVRATPSPSATSWPCAQYSISRAVANDVGLIGGPYQGTFVPGASVANAASIASNRSCQSARSASPRARPSSSWPCRKPSMSCAISGSSARNCSGRVAAFVASTSLPRRCATASPTSQPSAGVGVRRSAPRTRAARSACSSRRSCRSSM